MKLPVIDACVAIKWSLPEENQEKASAIFNRFNRYIVPDLFTIEFDSIITKKVRQKLVEPKDAQKIYNEIRKIPFTIIPYKMISKMAFDLSSALPISQYDACYLSVAIEYNQKVVTADRKFFNGMKNTPFKNYVAEL